MIDGVRAEHTPIILTEQKNRYQRNVYHVIYKYEMIIFHRK